MIRVALRQDERSAQFIVSGHAGYDERGKDIVCAGISTLVNTLANMVRMWADAKLIPIWMIWPDDDPHHIYVETGGDPAINSALDSIITEFCQFGGLYPDNVKVQILDTEATERSENNDTR